MTRLEVDSHGRKIAVVVDPSYLETPPGTRFVLRGNAFDFDGHPCWLGEKTGRPPLPAEMMGGGYCTPGRKPKQREPDDAELDDAEAIEFARREQERRPPNLLAPAIAA